MLFEQGKISLVSNFKTIIFQTLKSILLFFNCYNLCFLVMSFLQDVAEFELAGEYRQAKKFHELGLNKPYPVTKLNAIKTKYGRQIICEFEMDGAKETVFLPARYKLLSDKSLEKFHEGEYSLVVVGQLGRTWQIKFIQNEETQWP